VSEYVTTITEYRPKPITKQDGSSFTIHNFIDDRGITLTARADVANFVKGALNRPLRVTVRDEQKGDFLNHYLDHAELVTNGTSSPVEAAQQAQAAQTQQQPQPAAQTQPQPQVPAGPDMPLPKDRAIHRQTAAKVAAQLSTTTFEFWTNVQDLSRYFDTGLIPSRPEIGNPAGATPDDDIPF